jgi:ABC-2 type transport system ATP-binding protein
MLKKIKAERDLTVLLTTHYMDEADKLCDRIAIVDHGTLKALDSPLRLKAELAGKVTLDVGFASPPSGWLERLRTLPGVDAVSGDDRFARVTSSSGPGTTMALLELTHAAGVTVQTLSVNSTTLDDVFVHFTGRQLRDALQEPSLADRHPMFRR